MSQVLVPEPDRSRPTSTHGRGRSCRNRSSCSRTGARRRHLDAGTWHRFLGRPVACLAALLVVAGGSRPLQAQQRDRTVPRDSVATLAGKVVSAMTGGPLANARVVLKGSGLGTFTDSTGAFRIPNLPPGPDTVQVSLIGYASAQSPLVLTAGATTTATFLLGQTVLKLEELHVSVRGTAPMGKLGQFEEHRKGLGFYLTPEMIRKRHPQHSSDLLRLVPGLAIGPYYLGHASVRVTRLAENCSPPIFLDGIYRPGMQIDDINHDDIMAIEVYRGASETPPEYKTGNSACGAIIVWTQEGGAQDTTSGG